MAWFRNYYHCARCDEAWSDVWSCQCDTECPKCGKDFTPTESDDLTIVVERNESKEDRDFFGEFGVMLSPETAEETPDYVRVKSFETESDARQFAENLGKVI